MKKLSNFQRARKYCHTGGPNKLYYKYLAHNEYLYMFKKREDELTFWLLVILSEQS